MADIYPIATRQGARALIELMHRIGEVSNETCTRCDDAGRPLDDLDHRDYTSMAAMLAESLQRDVFSADEQHREGYLRAMTDLLCTVADGCCVELDDWDPIRNTHRAFDGRLAAA